MGVPDDVLYQDYLCHVVERNSKPLFQRTALPYGTADTRLSTKQLLSRINRKALPRPYCIGDYWCSDEHVVNLTRYINVPLETTTDGRAFTPPGSLKHLPLLTSGDQWDAQRNLVQWINYCVRATLAAKLLNGNPSDIRQLEMDTSHLVDDKGMIQDVSTFKDLVRQFHTAMLDGFDIQFPEEFYKTVDVFINKWDARYTYPNETNLSNVVHSHILSEWYKTRLLSGPDG